MPKTPRRFLKRLLILGIFLLATSCGSSNSRELVLIPTGPTTVSLGGTLQLNSTDPVTIWTVIGGEANGTIDPFGLYQAPSVMPPDPSVLIRAEFQGEDAFTIIELQP